MRSLGSKEDPDEAKNAAAIVGTENEDGYTFIFEVPASEQVRLSASYHFL